MSTNLISCYFIGLSASFISYNVDTHIAIPFFNGIATTVAYLYTRYSNRYKKQLLALSVVAAILFSFIPPIEKFFVLFFVPFILIYNHSKISLRSIPFAKIFLISFCWSYLVTVFPNGTIDFKRFLEFYMYIFILCIPFDIKDQEYDRLFSIKTIPMIIPAQLKIFAILILLVLHYSLFINSGESINYFIIHSLIVFSAVILSSRIKKHFFYVLLLDGSIFLRGLWQFF